VHCCSFTKHKKNRVAMSRSNARRNNKNKKNNNRRQDPQQAYQKQILSQKFTDVAYGNLKAGDIEADIINKMDIPDQFPQAVIKEVQEIVATQSNPQDLLKDPKREDLTHLPFVTIDGADARDFDDAVHSYPDPDGSNKDGHILWVAIADVSHYVRPGTALDKEAKKRGTSVYFPSKVVPMLPEGLSNGLCSLKPDEYRACVAYEMKISAKGKVINAKMHNGVMKSVARLTYPQVLAGIDGKPDAAVAPIMDTLIKPMHNVFKSLLQSREARGAINFGFDEISVHTTKENPDVPEFDQITGDDARCLIEEAMIAANISAARDENKTKQGVYRVQGKPSARKKDTIKELLTLGVTSATGCESGKEISGKTFVSMLEEAELSDDPSHAKSLILRMQKRAFYTDKNVGHFCLALPEYTHFTSPIRRYPDLMVHRNLKTAFNFSAEPQSATMESDAKHCSYTERRADKASKEANKQYTMSYLYDLQGQSLNARIVDVSAARGIRISIDNCNYHTNLSKGDLPTGPYALNQDKDALVNTLTGHRFNIGDSLDVSLHFGLRDDDDAPVVFLDNPDQALPQTNAQPAKKKNKGQNPQP
jgi:ribonuclease R